MDIWGQLQAKPTRSSSKTVQLVKHWDECGKRSKANRIYGVQVKYDGVNANLVVQGNTKGLYSRTGKELQNTAILLNLLPDLPNGVYACELVCDVCSLEELSGVVNPNRVKELEHSKLDIPMRMYLRCFDYVNIINFVIGKSYTIYKKRLDFVIDAAGDSSVFLPVPIELAFANPSREALQIAADRLIAEGHEGIVIADLGADWVAGHKGWRKMKIVRGVSYDLECVGYESGTGKLKNHVCNLLFKWKNGNIVKAMLGKGWTHHMMRNMYIDIHHSDETFAATTTPVGKIFEVYALQESSKGVLRLPKVGELRHDKDEADV